ncbi:hypothetical protein T03_14579 [Trichinella britovi]|uniref:Uncharacterized protein n=1 Tax=Trichinella britovi TaxID=45882 RepID=A0A0V0YXV4_TRIBR|nr:hypothetical protein T03_14579 [Trichinella britovi]
MNSQVVVLNSSQFFHHFQNVYKKYSAQLKVPSPHQQLL